MGGNLMGLKKDKEYFCIFYMNFEKVFEISMLLDNKIPTEQQTEDLKTHSTQLSARIKGMLSAIAGIEGDAAYSYANNSSLKKTIEIKSTNSIMLRQIIDEIKKNDVTLSNVNPGQLLLIRDVVLSMEEKSETEMRTMKMIKQGVLDKFVHEDIPIGELVKSLASDYAYILTASKESKKILLKIPSAAGNEFENQYMIDDLFMGPVSLIGIYRGEKKKTDLKSTFEFFTKAGEEVDSNEVIRNSSSDSQPLIRDRLEEDQVFSYIDVLAIVQEIKFE